MIEQKIVPSRRRGAEGGESEATNTEGMPPILGILEVFKQFFNDNKINLNVEDCVFMTLHPYKKHKKFDMYQSISKISDALRRKMRAYVMVREKNKIENHHHYHVLGYLAKEKTVNITGVKVWMEKVGSITNDIAPFTSVKQIINEYCPDDDGDFGEYKREIQQREGKRYACKYVKAKYSMEDQIKFILRYMTKENPTEKYRDYVILK